MAEPKTMGEWEIQVREVDGDEAMTRTCRACDGTGRLWLTGASERCGYCRGEGTLAGEWEVTRHT